VRRVTLREQAERLAARKRELGLVDDSRFRAAQNDGRLRTPEKRDLLRFIDEEAQRQGRANCGPSRGTDSTIAQALSSSLASIRSGVSKPSSKRR
jgi:hypothetical protein